MTNPSAPLLTVTFTGERDEIIELVTNGCEVTFGRDSRLCDLVVGRDSDGQSLSRVAGRVWRQWDQLWLANLSTSHDLFVQPEARPPEEPLPPLGLDGPVHARTLPSPRCFVTGPTGHWVLIVEQAFGPVSLPMLPGSGEATVRAPAVPEQLLDAAAALCEPLFAGARLPAPYGQVARRLGVSHKVARGRIERLVDLYEDQNPILRRHREERQARWDADLAGPTFVRGRDGILRSGRDDHGGVVGPDVARTAPRESSRDRLTSLPHSYDVAHLLIRRRLVTQADIDRLAIAVTKRPFPSATPHGHV